MRQKDYMSVALAVLSIEKGLVWRSNRTFLRSLAIRPSPAKIPACLERLSFSPGLGFYRRRHRGRSSFASRTRFPRSKILLAVAAPTPCPVELIRSCNPVSDLQSRGVIIIACGSIESRSWSTLHSRISRSRDSGFRTAPGAMIRVLEAEPAQAGVVPALPCVWTAVLQAAAL